MDNYRRYGTYSLYTMTNDELISLAMSICNDETSKRTGAHELLAELAERLKDCLYMIEATLDGRED